MKKFYLLVIVSLLSFQIFSQNKVISFTESETTGFDYPERIVNDQGLNGLSVKWNVSSATEIKKTVENTVYSYVNINGFTHMKEVGKPALPSYNDLVIVPVNAKMNINIKSVKYKEYTNFLIHPALKPAKDEVGAKEPDFEIDKAFYNSDITYPNKVVELTETLYQREMGIAVIGIRPVQYNPKRKTLRVYSEIEYEVVFSGATSFLNFQDHSNNYLNNLSGRYLNNGSLQESIKNYLSNPTVKNSNTKNYIILTDATYLAAAEKLATWKQQLGYSVEIVSNSSWTSSSVKNAVHSRYQTWTPKPDYFVIIGDHGDVPGEVITSSGSTFATDLYYACMGGSNDHVADMAWGRISVASLTQANTVIDKIIKYERNPITDTAFYRKALHAAYFQHAGNGYAERRFAQTAEELYQHMDTVENFNPTRVYVTGNSVNPLYWNNGNYSQGEPLPNYLKKPTFPWNGNYTHINAAINDGVLYVLHRDHGYENGWGDPAYSKTNINQLTNGDKLPVVISMNCLTGKYMETECFTERFLRKPNGGTVGIFGHAEVSYSGYNDALSFGLFDAIWSNPGVIPNFTGSGGINNPNLAPHGDLVTMGDARNQALIRMTETWGVNKYTNELFHWFGDPAMKLWTNVPANITANNEDTIQCGSDTTLQITSSSCLDCIASLVVDDELVGKVQLNNGSGTITFQPVSGAYGLLTLSKRDHRPYIDTIVVAGGCPKSKYVIGPSQYCIADSIEFTSTATGNITSYSWNFGAGASPQTANTIGPHNIVYSTQGNKTVTLTVTGPGGSHSYSTGFYIDQYCKYNIPTSGNITIDKCSGRLLDDGGASNYSNNTNGSVTISPSGASTITLYFNSFSFESGYDYLKIYDGPSTNSTLIGSYDGNSLPNNGIITSSGGSITIQQLTDQGVTESGFEIDWMCNFPNSAPTANFKVTDSTSCNGDISFVDLSQNGPVSWVWDFGDGTTSSQQNPTHVYTTNGTFSVKLTTTNSFGTDSVFKQNIVTINRPNAPIIIPQGRCNNGIVDVTAIPTGPGTFHWYDSMTGGNLLDTGLVYTTQVLSGNVTYYLENQNISAPLYGGKLDNSGGGGYLNYEHYLVFDVYKPVTLKAVDVYAGNAGSRLIQLQNSSGQVIQQKTIQCSAGKNTLELDFSLPIGTNLRLVGKNSPNLYRNNNGLNYPYTLPGVLSIKHSSASTSPTGYYYYFYNWKIEDKPCSSPRQAVPVTVSSSLAPITHFIFSMNDPMVLFSDSSFFANTYYWDFGDGNSSTLQNPTHTYSSNGNYTVKLVTTNNCGSDSITKTISIMATSINDILSEVENLRVYPNPTNDYLTIEFSTAKYTNLNITLKNVLGQELWTKQLTNFMGNYKNTVNLGNYSGGVYFISIKSNESEVFRKVIKR